MCVMGVVCVGGVYLCVCGGPVQRTGQPLVYKIFLNDKILFKKKDISAIRTPTPPAHQFVRDHTPCHSDTPTFVST
jgi:hypothetical protein